MIHNQPRYCSKDGIALVVVLAFVVLLTIAAMAFFARATAGRQLSNSSFNQARVDELARSALDIITGDLKQEIVDGSSVQTFGEHKAYLPLSAANIVPVRNPAPASPNPMPTLIRMSTDAAIPAPGADHPASDALSTNAAAGGRSISLARWNRHYLVPRDASATKDRDTTPIAAFQAPKWVYVTDQGPEVLSAPQSNVIGRYAYAIYDEGALLDANVAGYPMSPADVLPASSPHPSPDPKNLKRFGYGGKGSISFADLTALGTHGLSAGAVTDLVGWRNFASAQPLGVFKSFTFDSAGAARYFDSVVTNTNGFLKAGTSTWTPSGSGPRTDQALVSRQQLIDLQRSLGFSVDALQYLGTFSRAVTTPSWGPSYNAVEFGGNAANAYKDKADDPSSVNRNLLGVRLNTAGTIRDYADDGTFEEVSIEQGAPLVRKRFSLAKLAWLGHSGANSAAFSAGAVPSEAIKDCFGLTWNSSKQRWDYSHGDSNNILTLEEVRQQKRAPDFFELLKAGILSGSVGQQPGSGGGVDTATTGPAGLAFNYYSSEKDRHILQIGANIIDQADADNYPTAIFQPIVDGNYSVPYGEKELFDTVFGIENLPYLQRMSAVSYARNVGSGKDPTPSDPSGDPWKQGTEDVWLQPEVWNPHERTTADPAKYTETPGHLRLVTYGGCQVKVSETDAASLHKQTRERTFDWIKDFGTNPTSPDLGGIVAFVNPKPGNTRPNDLFASPVALESAGVTSNSPTNYYDSSSASGPKNYMYYANPGAGTRLMGVWLGEFNRDPRDWQDGGFPTHKVEILPVNNAAEPQMTFVLEYNDKPDGTGQWLPYTVMARVQEFRNTVSYGDSQRAGWISWFKDWGAGRPDPRTDRFSSHSGRINSSGTTYNYQWSSDSSIRPSGIVKSKSGSPSGKGSVSYLMPATSEGFFYQLPLTNSFSTAYLLDDWAWNLAATDSRSHFWYADADGVVRPGDAWRADYGTRPTGPADDRVAADVACGDGVPLYEYTELLTSKDRRRPVILNRPFQSVGELGYVYRDLPFKTLDLSSEKSADAGLMDLFCVRDEPEVTSGRVNLSASPPAVLQAIVTGTLQNSAVTPSVTISTTEASAVAEAVADELSSSPLASVSGIVHQLGAPIYTALTSIASNNTATNKPISNKGYSEGPVRSLSSVVNTRTWNLLIDVIAQSGRFPPNAKSLDNFIVEGEKRFWLHVAIDRLTGQIIDRQLEPVYE